MSDIAIRAEGVSKVFRLYAQPHYRFLDMFGLLKREGAYQEHIALAEIDIQIRRGEKVAFIGRNGAGKSTLLKLITGVTHPTTGTLEVGKGIHALLQIGVGFHPEFTGRENAYSYLAHMGIAGRDADRLIREIVEFSEIEEYVDQPIKTYSSGMVARLMFAASTVVSPEILVLDEILGVGDAYFAQKSYERIRELCTGNGTTVLLVTHDVYSAAKLCERMIWLDRGRIMLDRDSATVIKAYEDSIRQQEQNRLRLRKQAQFSALSTQRERAERTQFILEFLSHDGTPLASPIYFHRVALMRVGKELAVAPVTSQPIGEPADQSHLQSEGGCWGDVVEWNGLPARAMQHFGSPFHKVACIFDLLGEFAPADVDEMSVEVTSASDADLRLVATLYWGKHERKLKNFEQSFGTWKTFEIPLKREASELLSGDFVGQKFGTGTIVVDDLVILDKDRQETYHLRYGEEATIQMNYRVANVALRENAQVVLAFHKDGVQTACRFITRDLLFDGANACGIISFRLPRVLLGNGTYTVTVMIAEDGYYDRQQVVFFTINPGVYCCLSKIVEFIVTDGGLISEGTMWVGDAEWSLGNPEMLAG